MTAAADQALQVWKMFPPRHSWLKLEIGIDGWVVEVLHHGDHFKPKKVFETDEYGEWTLAEAIEEAYRIATERECWVP